MAKKLHHMEIHPGENGSHVVEHHMTRDLTHKSGSGVMYEEPEVKKHAFGGDSHAEMLHHIAKELNLKHKLVEDTDDDGE